MRVDAVDAAARPQHGRGHGPGAGARVVDLVRRGLVALETAAEAAAEDVDAPADEFGGDVVALAGQVGQGLPGVAPRVVDGEVVAARRPPAGDVDAALVHHRGAGTAAGGHARLLDPACLGTLARVQRVDRVDIGGVGVGLAAEVVDHAVHGGGHAVVQCHRQVGAAAPAVGLDVVDLHRAHADAAPRVAAEHVDAAAGGRERELGVRLQQRRPAPPLARRRVSPGRGHGRDARRGGLRQGGARQRDDGGSDPQGQAGSVHLRSP